MVAAFTAAIIGKGQASCARIMSSNSLCCSLHATSVIPTTTSRRAAIPYDVVAYRRRNSVERLWAQLKDFRRVATRYDKLAANFLAGFQIAAIVAFWIK